MVIRLNSGSVKLLFNSVLNVLQLVTFCVHFLTCCILLKTRKDMKGLALLLLQSATNSFSFFIVNELNFAITVSCHVNCVTYFPYVIYAVELG
jgi:hypothetical protein